MNGSSSVAAVFRGVRVVVAAVAGLVLVLVALLVGAAAGAILLAWKLLTGRRARAVDQGRRSARTMHRPRASQNDVIDVEAREVATDGG